MHMREHAHMHSCHYERHSQLPVCATARPPICTHARARARRSARTDRRSHARTHARMHACTHSLTHARMHALTHGCACSYRRTHASRAHACMQIGPAVGGALWSALRFPQHQFAAFGKKKRITKVVLVQSRASRPRADSVLPQQSSLVHSLVAFSPNCFLLFSQH